MPPVSFLFQLKISSEYKNIYDCIRRGSKILLLDAKWRIKSRPVELSAAATSSTSTFSRALQAVPVRPTLSNSQEPVIIDSDESSQQSSDSSTAALPVTGLTVVESSSTQKVVNAKTFRYLPWPLNVMKVFIRRY
jgi:hypothetical protein